MNIVMENYVESIPILNSMSHFYKKYIGCKTMRQCGIYKMADKDQESEQEQWGYESRLGFLSDDSGAASEPVIISKVKPKCISAKRLLMDYLACFLLMFSIHRLFKENLFFEEYKKDTLYRFLNREGANWEHLQLLVGRNVVLDIEKRTTSDHINVLIFDDSPFIRASGKGTEYCGYIYDHTDGRNKLGWRMMTGAWSNGETLIPLTKCLLTSRDPKCQVGPFTKRDGRTIEGKRRKMATTKGTDVVNKMVDDIKDAGVPFDYVLFDRWFSNPSQIIDLKADRGCDVVAMVKKSNAKFVTYDPWIDENRSMDIKEIYARNKKRRGKSRYLLSVEASVIREGVELPVRLLYVRNKKNRKDWVCLITTDLNLSEDDIIQIYMMRREIECYFKIVKTNLRLTTECHSRSYDALTAHVVIAALRYMILAIDKFNWSDSRTINQLFDQAKREVVNHMIGVSLHVVIDCLIDAFVSVLHPTEVQMTEIYLNYWNSLPEYWQKKFKRPETGIPA